MTLPTSLGAHMIPEVAKQLVCIFPSFMQCAFKTGRADTKADTYSCAKRPSMVMYEVTVTCIILTSCLMAGHFYLKICRRTACKGCVKTSLAITIANRTNRALLSRDERSPARLGNDIWYLFRCPRGMLNAARMTSPSLDLCYAGAGTLLHTN